MVQLQADMAEPQAKRTGVLVSGEGEALNFAARQFSGLLLDATLVAGQKLRERYLRHLPVRPAARVQKVVVEIALLHALRSIQQNAQMCKAGDLGDAVIPQIITKFADGMNVPL